MGTVSANDILLIAATINVNPTVTAPAGYSTLVDAANEGTNHKLVVFWLPQGATSFSTNAVEHSTGIVLHITGAHASPRRPRSRR